MAVVVVFPWVPAMTTGCCFVRKSSSRASGKLMCGMPSRRTALASTLSARSALPTTARSMSALFKFAAEYGVKTRIFHSASLSLIGG